MSEYPKWATPDRQALLVKLFIRSQGFCIYGHRACLIPEHHYEVYTERLIDDWQADDRQQRLAEWQAERRQLHSTADRRYPRHGQFSAVSKDIFFGSQPLYYIVGLSISGLGYQPIAQVRVSSSFAALYIELGDTLRGLSKSKRRKAVRYGRPLPKAVEAEIASICRQAVRHYLDNR